MTIFYKGPASSWNEKVLSADSIWSQIDNILTQNSAALPQTPRRPEVRLIVDNTSGLDKIFPNPANHANSKAEVIPASGDKKAAMVMVRGATLAEQNANAQTLYDKFDLGHQGLSDEFVAAIKKDRAGGLVNEAYGPAPFAGQAGKLVDLDWHNKDGSETKLAPVFGDAAAYGARAATNDTAFHTVVHIYVQGSGTTPEMIESSGMVIAIEKDWETGKVSTRPIVASVAEEFYGDHFDGLPQVTVDVNDGYVTKIDLQNGMVFEMANDSDAPGAQPGMAPA